MFCQTLWMQPTSGNLWFRHLESRMKDPLEKMKPFLLTNNNPTGILVLKDLEDHLVEYTSRVKIFQHMPWWAYAGKQLYYIIWKHWVCCSNEEHKCSCCPQDFGIYLLLLIDGTTALALDNPSWTVLTGWINSFNLFLNTLSSLVIKGNLVYCAMPMYHRDQRYNTPTLWLKSRTHEKR